MARPLRFQASGAVYRIMGRGDVGKDVFVTGLDRETFPNVLERACGRLG